MNKNVTRMLLFLLLAAFPARLFAQGNLAGITGQVTAPEEGPLIGAKVTVKNESTGFQTSSLTDPDGNFIFKQLPLGSPYSVSVSALGYAEQKKTGYALNLGDELRVDFTMQISAMEIADIEVIANSLKNTIKTL